jgi:hypothetical protein
MKQAQFTSLNSGDIQGKTLHDLYLAIQHDTSISMMERQQLMQQIKGVTGFAPSSTPLTSLLSRGLGGVVGYLISKYFGMGVAGRVVGTAMGYGLGRLVYDQFNKPKNPYPGYDLLD